MVRTIRVLFRGGSNIDLSLITCKDKIVIPSKLQRYILHWYYCPDEKSDHIFRGIASPPPFWERFYSSFRSLKFSHWIFFRLLKDKQNIIKKWVTRYNTQKFAHFNELVKFIIGPKGLVIAPFRFLRSKIFFEFVLWFGTSFFRLIW